MKTAQVHLPFKLSLLICCLLLLSAQAIGQDKPADKITRLLEQSGYTYTKTADNIWAIPFHGKALPDFDVFITQEKGVVVTLVLVAEKNQFKADPDLMRSLLRMNDDIDRVKISIGKEGRLTVRIDASLRLLDQEEFKGNVEQVASAADMTGRALKPYLTTSQ